MTPKKYIIIAGFSPICFEAPVEHRDFKAMIEGMRNKEMLPGGMTSGGYYMVFDGKVETGVGSFTMPELKPDPHDAEILQKFLFGKKKPSEKTSEDLSHTEPRSHEEKQVAGEDEEGRLP